MPPRSTPALLDLVDEHADRVIAVEDETAAAVTALYAAELAVLDRAVARRWVLAAGALSAGVDGATLAVLLAAVRALLDALVLPDPAPVVRSAARRAADLGAEQAVEVLGVAAAELDLPPGRLSGPVRAALDALAAVPAAARGEAVRRLPEVRTWPQMTGVLAAAHTASTRAEAAARWVVNHAVNDSASAVAAQVGAQKVWVAERDACLDCLGYAGHVVDADARFPGGLSFRPRPRFGDPLDGPPLHPRCRCHVTPWRGEQHAADVTFPEALRREAERSVLRGVAGNESQKQLVAAADRLLRAGTGLPKTVQQRAAAAVARGQFTTTTTRGGRRAA